MLIFSNRVVEDDTGQPVFGRRFRPLAGSLSIAEARRAGGGWRLHGVQRDASDEEADRALCPMFAGARAVLVYLHGNANTPADCFERCAQLAALYGVEVIGFSWPSEGLLADGNEDPGLVPGRDASNVDLDGVTQASAGKPWAQRKLQRYRRAKLNAQESVQALARFVRLAAAARLYTNVQPMSIAAHSLGAHFLQHALEQPGALESLGAAHNIALLAPCTRSAGHVQWLARLRPRGQVFVTFNRDDIVLAGARIADGDDKLGANPGERLRRADMRYVSFDGAATDLGGHRYFVEPPKVVGWPKATRRLFGRLFASQADLQGAELDKPRRVYPLGCDADGSTCYMAKP
jgi:esterase/lipase superfamily enzyme